MNETERERRASVVERTHSLKRRLDLGARMEFYGHDVTQLSSAYDTANDKVIVTLTIAGTLPSDLLRGRSEDLKKAFWGMDVESAKVVDTLGEETTTEIVLKSSYDNFMESTLDTLREKTPLFSASEIKERVDTLHALLNKAEEEEEEEMSNITNTENTVANQSLANLMEGAKIAGATQLNTAFIDVVKRHLKAQGVNVEFLDSELGKAIAALAVPTALMAGLSHPMSKQVVPETAHDVLCEAADKAQLGASIEGTQKLVAMVLPMIAELVAVAKAHATGTDLTSLLGSMTTDDTTPSEDETERLRRAAIAAAQAESTKVL